MQRFDFRNWCWAAIAAAGALVALDPGTTLAGRPAITVSGGGVGEFLDPNPCDGFQQDAPFGVSNFAVSATVQDDGSVSGTFMCQVKGCVVIVQGVFTDVLGIDQSDGAGDPDTVFLLGEAAFVDLTGAAGGPGVVRNDNGDPFIFDFCIELREGRRGEGRFFYTDGVVLLGGPACLGLDDGYDEEEIVAGHIQIQFKGDIADMPFDRVNDCPVEPLPCE